MHQYNHVVENRELEYDGMTVNHAEQMEVHACTLIRMIRTSVYIHLWSQVLYSAI